ncbi:MAG: hypothetical protein NW201_10845 [Gemmatimonadales bacterium]|nr:hypothetical protein [Gemmatimonadales bacterium]
MSWLALAGFGAFHGLNPAMGWLFAVSLALQRQDAREVWRALGPIALGHAAALAAAAALVLLLGVALPARTLALVCGGVLLAFGAWKLARWYRHPRWVGMDVGRRDLVLWSFLMATSHGAGLMVAPQFAALASPLPVLAGVGVHTAAMLTVMGGTAWLVHRHVGLRILRTHWVNLDLVWAAALLVAGGVALW